MIDELPLWLSILVSVCVVLGAGLTMAGCLGLVRFPDFYRRIHAPTVGTSMGGGLILVASAIFFTVTQQRLVIHEMVIFLFVTVTTPVTLMLLARATLFRDRIEEARDTPPSDAPKD
ncbi:monovalent cation/H(+) antiporter subunit G [Devosia sp.]|uniref:monovalent cation/H(+) antiporter subunit G n=1 Tax=Devosia sp. TaxID=1871048 RepID=UPI003F7038A3